MVTKTSIEWTEMTWNPVTGCDRVSPGCDNCYALAMARRLKAMGSKNYQTMVTLGRQGRASVSRSIGRRSTSHTGGAAIGPFS